MSRNFGIMNGPVSLGGVSTDRPAYGAHNTRADINSYFPSGSILADPVPPLERSEITQSLIDVGAVFFAFLFASLFGLAIVGAIGVLFFV